MRTVIAPAPLIAPLLLKLKDRHALDPDEIVALEAVIGDVREVAAETVVIEADCPLDRSTLLLDGLLGRAKTLNGAGRQIVEIHVPGDFADLHSFLLKRLDSRVVALTTARVATVAHGALEDIMVAFPRLARVLWFLTTLDAALHREWEVSLGRRPALSRLAALLCELQARLTIVGLADEDRFVLRLTQAQLGDCLGLTSVHVNRTVRELRERNLAEMRRGEVRVPDLNALREAAEWTPSYLYTTMPHTFPRSPAIAGVAA